MMCIDYSIIVNLITHPDVYPPPEIGHQIIELAGYYYISTLDLKNVYRQIPIKEREKPYSSFEANERLYQFKTIPFDATNVVAVFQRFMDNIFEEKIERYIFIPR